MVGPLISKKDFNAFIKRCRLKKVKIFKDGTELYTNTRCYFYATVTKTLVNIDYDAAYDYIGSAGYVTCKQVTWQEAGSFHRLMQNMIKYIETGGKN